MLKKLWSFAGNIKTAPVVTGLVMRADLKCPIRAVQEWSLKYPSRLVTASAERLLPIVASRVIASIQAKTQRHAVRLWSGTLVDCVVET